MIKRYPGFDALRVFALGMILACHFIRTIGFYCLDIPLGCIGNMIFFCMSGWLLGIAWKAKGEPKYGFKFILRRFTRLAVPLWLFAIPWMAYLNYRGGIISLKDVFLNLSLLNWFDRLPGMTPFWFITAIAAFYLWVIAISRISKIRNVLLLCGFFVLAQIFLSALGIRYGYILIFILTASLCFLYGDVMFETVMRMSYMWMPMIALLGMGLFLMFWCLVLKDVLIVGTPSCYYATLPIAGAICFVILKAANIEYKLVHYVSSISYEVFLVHAAFLLVLKPFTDNVIGYALLFLCCSFLVGGLLNLVSGKILARLRK